MIKGAVGEESEEGGGFRGEATGEVESSENDGPRKSEGDGKSGAESGEDISQQTRKNSTMTRSWTC